MIAFSHTSCFLSFFLFSYSSLRRQRLISHDCRTPKCIISLFRRNKENPLKVIPAKRAKLSVNGSLDTGIEFCYECNVTIDHLAEKSHSAPASFRPFNLLSHKNYV